MKDWNNHIASQQIICDQYQSKFVLADPELKIGIADNIKTNLQPINGLRHPLEDGTSGWFIWAGETFSEDADFFQPHCVKHLETIKPEIIKFLGLSPGHRFLIDDNGYEDVWFDENLLNI